MKKALLIIMLFVLCFTCLAIADDSPIVEGEIDQFTTQTDEDRPSIEAIVSQHPEILTDNPNYIDTSDSARHGSVKGFSHGDKQPRSPKQPTNPSK